jgi:hypothetical protein
VNTGREFISQISRAFGAPLPAVYATYLTTNDETLREDGLLLYGSNSLLERNTSLYVQRHVSEFLAVGDDSGGSLIVIRFSDPAARPFLVDGGALVSNMPQSLLKPLADSWLEWQRTGFPLP